MRFDPASALYAEWVPASLGNVLADAERGGYDIEPVWVVTTLGPTRGVTFHEPPGWDGWSDCDRWVTVAIPVPLGPAGTWRARNVGHDQPTSGWTVSRCAITHHGPPCPGEGCEVWEAQQRDARGDRLDAATLSAAAMLEHMLKGRPDPRDASSWGRE